eukprot:18421-Heterococcus_DN1.PRE.2
MLEQQQGSDAKLTGSMNARSHSPFYCGAAVPLAQPAVHRLGAAAQFDCRKHARDAPAAIEAAHWRCERIAGGGAETCAAAQQGERPG